MNKNGTTVSPDQTAQLASVWSGASGFGKFKALLTVNYGNQEAAVQDTVFFWVVPWVQILEIFAASLVAIVILWLYFQRWLETRHLGRLAAGPGARQPEALAAMRDSSPPPIIPMPTLPSLPSVPPPAEIIERVQSQVREKRTIFNLFKRQGFVSMPEPLVKSMVAHAPPQNHAPKHASSTIDLKNIRKSAPETLTTDQHIINLKKPPL